jgi:hypothetical protein
VKGLVASLREEVLIPKWMIVIGVGAAILNTIHWLIWG